MTRWALITWLKSRLIAIVIEVDARIARASGGTVVVVIGDSCKCTEVILRSEGGSGWVDSKGLLLGHDVCIIVGAGFRVKLMRRDCEPTFAKGSNETFPIFVENICGFESTKEVAVDFGVIVFLIVRLLCKDCTNEVAELGNVSAEGVCG